MKLIVGDHLGLVKTYNMKTKTVESKYGETNLENPVINLYAHDSETTAIVRKKDFNIADHIRQISGYTLSSSLGAEFISSFSKQVLGERSYFLGESKNKIRVVKPFLDDEGADDAKEIEIGKYSYENGTLTKLSACKKADEFYCLYQDTPLKIFDIEKGSVIFKSKNVPNDELDLRVPIWDTDVVEDESRPSLFYVSNGFGKIRTYDRKAKSQPIADQSEFTKLPIKKINRMIEVENYLCIGDITGRVVLLEKRKSKLLN